MATPFLSEIRLFSFNFAPRGWALCNGQILPINQNQALFSLLGTTYGGNGQTTFALPDLRGRVPIHFLGDYPLGAVGGEIAHSLTLSEMPSHNHFVQGASVNGDTVLPSGAKIGAAAGLYGPATGLTNLASAAISNYGSSQPHINQQPYSVISFCIALQGVFPSQT